MSRRQRVATGLRRQRLRLASRAAVAAVPEDDLDLVGIAVRGPQKTIDKILLTSSARSTDSRHAAAALSVRALLKV
ncbi:MAG: DUF2000 family protein [Actinobacteria bacterium]|nr:DUF2000 family protein [Actinomycetota bacterium]